MMNLTDLKEWHNLAVHQKTLANKHLRDLYQQDPQRFQQFSLSVCDIFLDFSRNLIDTQTLDLLCALAEERQLKQTIQAQFSGHAINTTENRPALHTICRDLSEGTLLVDGKDVKAEVNAALNQMHVFAEQIHQGNWRGVTGEPIKHVVNVGIGGSYTGPLLTIAALKDFACSDLQFHFISSIDKSQLNEVWQQIDPAKTLFIISSKSFTTIETLTNAQTLAALMQAKLGPDALAKHFVAVTAAQAKAQQFGILPENIFPLWEWVGGRYSIWSAIGLPLMLMIGFKNFKEFLAGAHAMDQHFQQAEFKHNMPVILGLLGIWYLNFFLTPVQAIIPYSHRLRYLVPYLQQADMESNGKTVNLNGTSVDFTTGPVLFGEEGVIGQHAYHQLLHQGTHFIPADFIVVGKSAQNDPHENVLIASALAQAQALMVGKTADEAQLELLAKKIPKDTAAKLAQHQAIPGGKPTNILILKSLTPKTLGALIALYEHKIFVQGVIWGINSFDQWGVELGKQLLPSILDHLQGKTENTYLDSATLKLIKHIQS